MAVELALRVVVGGVIGFSCLRRQFLSNGTLPCGKLADDFGLLSIVLVDAVAAAAEATLASDACILA